MAWEPAPAGGFAGQEEELRDEIQSIVRGLLTLVGIEADPLQSPSAVFLASLVEHARRFEVGAADSAGTWPAASVRAWLDGVLDRLATSGFARGERSWARSLNGPFVTLDEKLLEEAGLTVAEAVVAVCDAARHEARLVGAYSPHDARPPALPAWLLARAVSGWYPGRAGHLVLVPRPYVALGTSGNAAQHGSSYGYDTRVPLLLWGRGVCPGEHWDAVETTALASTLAALLGIRPPPASSDAVLASALAGCDASSRPAR